MMTDALSSQRLIDSDTLDNKNYFNSLLAAALGAGLLTVEDAERVRTQCLALLAKRATEYTRGKSSSMRIETASRLADSMFFVLGLALSGFPSHEEAIKALSQSDIDALFTIGRKKMKTKINVCGQLYRMVRRTLLDTPNVTYTATVTDGIEGFFKLYDPEFDATEIHITADYPLFVPITDRVGIEFIEKYLTAICYENKFCEYFSAEDIHLLLLSHDIHYSELIFNVFEKVLIASLGSAIVGGSPSRLRHTHEETQRLCSLTPAQAELAVPKALKAVSEFFNPGDGLMTYIMSGIDTLIFKFGHARSFNLFPAWHDGGRAALESAQTDYLSL